MKPHLAEAYVMRYLEATGCQVVEKGSGFATVKLSPEADKDLTGRSYYWNFVERTGVDPETMTYTFVFDPEMVEAAEKTTDLLKGNAAAGVADSAAGNAPAPIVPTPISNSILGRYFGVSPTIQTSRFPKDIVSFGSRRLEQIFSVACQKGRFIRLFEVLKDKNLLNSFSVPYRTWLGIVYKVEFLCDMKKEEIHSFGIELVSGEIIENFHARMLKRKLAPRLPENVHLQPMRITLERGTALLENKLEQIIKNYDYQWADAAWERLRDEWHRIDTYYDELLPSLEEEKKKAAAEQYRSRLQEMDWQYRPRVHVTVISGGLFHLGSS